MILSRQTALLIVRDIEINALRDEFIKIQADPNISPERKDKYRQRLLEEINDLLQKRNQ